MLQIGASCGWGTKDVSTMLDPQALRELIRKNEAIIYEREVQSFKLSRVCRLNEDNQATSQDEF